ncbi:MAG TPA: TetR/AcrR family transcriptional regulator [Trebonia sp.]|nr:TetR/AcrR family transcriptional regulator [Trebonia sp.]
MTKPDSPQPAEPGSPGGTDGRALGEKGARTRRRLLEAAEQVFADLGYHDASIVKITEAAGVSQGTFYLYFGGKQEIFDVLVEDLNTRLRHAMSDASAKGNSRIEAERLGFDAFFRFTAEHPALYRVIRQAEFASPRMLRLHYERLAEGYVTGLRSASDEGEISIGDPVVTAWALMAVGEMIGMRWILWGDTRQVPPEVFHEAMGVVARVLGVPAPPEDPDAAAGPSEPGDDRG